MMRRGVEMPTVERVVRRTKVERADLARADLEQGRVRIHKPHPSARPPWPDHGGVEWAFQDAKRFR